MPYLLKNDIYFKTSWFISSRGIRKFQEITHNIFKLWTVC